MLYALSRLFLFVGIGGILAALGLALFLPNKTLPNNFTNIIGLLAGSCFCVIVGQLLYSIAVPGCMDGDCECEDDDDEDGDLWRPHGLRS